jgi:FAD synthase
MRLVERIEIIEGYEGKLGLSIGNFEGFHRGHLKILNTLIVGCRNMGLFSAAVTFKEHPLKVLSGYEPEKLCSPADKIGCFERSGIDLLFSIDFSRRFAQTPPVDFIRELDRKLRPRLLCVGSSFRFGKGNEGNISLLEKLSREFGYLLLSVEEELYEDEPISSTRIRGAIKLGRFRHVFEMLGRVYSVYLVREEGAAALHTFVPNLALPAHGVFTGTVRTGGEGVQCEETGRWEESFRLDSGLFFPVRHDRYRPGMHYQFSFDPEDQDQEAGTEK